MCGQDLEEGGQMTFFYVIPEGRESVRCVNEWMKPGRASLEILDKGLSGESEKERVGVKGRKEG